MQTKSVNLLVREVLDELGLTIHFYSDILLYALNELQRMAVHHQMNAKQVTLAINGYDRVKIPTDCLQILDISIKSGDRLLQAVRDSRLNRMYNFDNNGNRIPFPDPGGTNNEEVTIDFLTDLYSERSRYGYGAYFGLSAPERKTFNIDFQNSEIVFSNDFKDDEVVLTYVNDPVTCSSCSLVRFEFWDVIRSYAKMMFINNDKYYNIYEKRAAFDEYKTRKRNMKSLVYPVSKADLLYSVRRGIHGGLKN